MIDLLTLFFVLVVVIVALAGALDKEDGPWK
jgi:hypothetical protein